MFRRSVRPDPASIAQAIVGAAQTSTVAVTGTAYTLAATDANQTIEASNASAQTITVPPNASVAIPIGTTIKVRQMGAGKVTVAPGAAVTLRSAGALLSTAAQYAEIELTKRAVNEWVVTGNRIA